MKFAGFDLDEEYAREEARRKAAAEEAERQRQRKELEARVQKRRKKAEPATVPPVSEPALAPRPAVDASAVSYANLLWQPQAYREAGKTDKKLLHYDQSLAQLRSARYDRHARPAEVMSLLCAGLEGKLTPEQKAVADDMLVSYGEWVGLSWERQKDKLIVSLDAKGLVWKKDRYVKDKFRCTEQKEFDITGKASQKYIDLQEFEEALIQYHYGRSFADLPQEMREGDKRAQLYLPADGTTWPVGRGNFNYWFYFGGRAARGVAVGAPRAGSTGKWGNPP